MSRRPIVFIGNLDPVTTASEIFQLASRYVEAVRGVSLHQRGRTACAFVEFGARF